MKCLLLPTVSRPFRLLLAVLQDATGFPATSIKLREGTHALDEAALVSSGSLLRAALAGLAGGKGGYVCTAPCFSLFKLNITN